MTAKQRILTALGRGQPDSIPVSPFIVMRFAYRTTGRVDWRGIFAAHQQLGTTPFNIKLPVNFDVNLSSGWSKVVRIREQAGEPEIKERQVRAPFWGDVSGPTYFDAYADRRERRSVPDTTTEITIETPVGTLTSQKKEGFIPHDPKVPKIAEYLIKNRRDYKIYLAFLEKWVDAATPRVAELTDAVREMGEDGVFTVWVYNIFSDLAQGGREIQELFLDLYDEPELMREVWQVMRRLKEKEIQAFNESEAEVLIYDQGWVSGDLIGPDFFEQWILPDLRWAAEKIGKDKYLGFYSSGKLTDFLPQMVEAGPAFIETFDPIGDNISLGEAKKRYGDRICVMGNFHSILLAMGGLQEAKEETLRCLDEGAEGGGYILGTAGEVPVDTRIENLRVMIDVAREYGNQMYGSA